jgi:(p)ppGpp synthase/HD superfamily hydrolase
MSEGEVRAVQWTRRARGMARDDEDLLKTARAYATACHADTNHTYDGRPYAFHLAMVADMVARFRGLLAEEHRQLALAGAWVHDVIEDARQTYNDVAKATSVEVAEVAYALTNEKGRTRAERANDRYYEGIRANPVAHFVKICDRLANATHAASTGSRMVEVYRREYAEFRAKLWREEFAPMFAHLEQVLGVAPVGS